MTIGRIQFIRKSVLGAAIAVGVWMFAFTNSTLDAAAVRHEMIEWVGIVAIVVCILGRTWTSLYIGGRKVEQFVVLGPYSVMRNPLYFFSILGAFGAGAQLGSLISGAIFGVLAWIVFYVVIVQEEHLMAKRYGVVFERYVETVPRFLPNPRLWRDEPTPNGGRHVIERASITFVIERMRPVTAFQRCPKRFESQSGVVSND